MARTKFTAATLADYARTGFTAGSLRGDWAVQADLAYELADVTGREVAEFRTLLAAVNNGLPIVITWNLPLGDRVEVKTATVIVEQFFAPTAHHSGRVHVHYWGFSHPITLADIESIEVPDTAVSYRPAAG